MWWARGRISTVLSSAPDGVASTGRRQTTRAITLATTTMLPDSVSVAPDVAAIGELSEGEAAERGQDRVDDGVQREDGTRHLWVLDVPLDATCEHRLGECQQEPERNE